MRQKAQAGGTFLYNVVNFKSFLLEDRPPSEREEWANAVTHGVGAALGVVALVALVAIAAGQDDAWRIVTLSVYGTSLVVLYLASTLYHSTRHPRIKRLFRLCDHLAIYFLIAGTYTPIVLGPMRGPWGWTLFGLIWGLAIGGVLVKTMFFGRLRALSVVFYLAMGWLAVLAFEPMIRLLPSGLIGWILAGGLFYTTGVLFFCLKRMRYNHAIWHVFVLAGSACHFMGILLHVAIV